MPFWMHVCQQPSTGPAQVGSGSAVPPSSAWPPSGRPPSPPPPSIGSPGQKLAPFARKHASALSAHRPSMHAAPRYARLPTSHAQHEGRHSANVVHAVPAAAVPESSLGDAGHVPFCCSPLEDTVEGAPPSAVPFADEPLHANTSAVRRVTTPKRRSALSIWLVCRQSGRSVTAARFFSRGLKFGAFGVPARSLLCRSKVAPLIFGWTGV